MIVIILLMLFITSKIDKEGETNSRNIIRYSLTLDIFNNIIKSYKSLSNNPDLY